MASIKLKDLLKETIDDQEAKELEKAMGQGFKDLESALSSMEDEAKADVEQVDESILEGRLDEKGQLKEELTTVAIIGILLAAPKFPILYKEFVASAKSLPSWLEDLA